MPKLSRAGGPSTYDGGEPRLVGNNSSIRSDSQRRPPRMPERQSRPTVRVTDNPSSTVPEPAGPSDTADSAGTSGHGIDTPTRKARGTRKTR